MYSNRNGLCISTEYVNANTPMQWHCSEGHEWNASFNNIKNGKKWCHIAQVIDLLLSKMQSNWHVIEMENIFLNILLIVVQLYYGNGYAIIDEILTLLQFVLPWELRALIYSDINCIFMKRQ